MLELIVTRHPRFREQALLSAGGLVFPAMLGRNGLRLFKREGDGATPVARMRLLYGFCRADRLHVPPTRLKMISIRQTMGWCDAPGHPAYNQPVRLPFGHSHEPLARDDGLYDICLVLDWNIGSRRRHRGSAIFFHLTGSERGPTEGCIAIQRADMLRLLPALGPDTHVTVRW
ncbi:MAG: L,D-transpeptidase family protein [Alphaproteobacteria bacterium]|nr:L,D-transpeptidase family protein [Alphaproteobacteria bacterium]